MSPPNGWIVVPRAAPRARARLFCIPHAGAGPSRFRTWLERMPADLELCLVQLPGRETRFAEAPYERMDPLIAALVPALRPHLTLPFALFGHSMGAVVAFEAARALRRAALPLPRCLFVSAYRAPHLPDPDPPVHVLPPDAFWRELRRLNGTPPEVLDNEEWMRLAEPVLRADFAVHETYAYREEAPLPCAVVALGGSEDREVPRWMLEAWRRHAGGAFALETLPGDHFFLESARGPLVETLRGHLERALEGEPIDARTDVDA